MPTFYTVLDECVRSPEILPASQTRRSWGNAKCWKIKTANHKWWQQTDMYEKLKSMQHKMNIRRIQISFTPFCQGGCVLRHWAVVWTPSLRLWILLPALQVSKVPKVYRDHPTSSTIPERFCNNVTRRHLEAPLCASRKCGGGVGTSNEIYPFSKPVLHEIQQHWNDSHWIDWQHG